MKSSVRDDKLQFGERSSEILTRASSKPLYQLQNDIFISQWDGADSWKTKCLVAGRLARWLQEKMNIFLHRCQFLYVCGKVTSFLWFASRCHAAVATVAATAWCDGQLLVAGDACIQISRCFWHCCVTSLLVLMHGEVWNVGVHRGSLKRSPRYVHSAIFLKHWIRDYQSNNRNVQRGFL